MRVPGLGRGLGLGLALGVAGGPVEGAPAATPRAAQLERDRGAAPGTGTRHRPRYLADLTGGGPMPSTAGAAVARCAGDGRGDDTACLQAAIDAAAQARRPLLIPATGAFYRLTAPLQVRTSLLGIGGRPVLRQTADCATRACEGLRLAEGMSGWIHNLHVVGMFGGVRGEFAHNVSVGGVDGVTIAGNVLESPIGDNIADNAQETGKAAARNVLIDGNTLIGPARCAISLVNVSDRWAIVNNRILVPSPWVSPIDLEPWRPGSRITNVEVGWNELRVGDNREAARAGDFLGGVTASGWFDPDPGENVWVHHNFGTWPFPRLVTISSRLGTFRNVVDEGNEKRGR